ncbi:hypothetical protein AB0B51_35665, partial [Streptomyces griseus]
MTQVSPPPDGNDLIVGGPGKDSVDGGPGRNI